MGTCKDVERSLANHGLLLLQDKNALDIVGIVAGEKLATSWWSHPKGQAIFACLQQLDDDADVLVSRLVAGKVTYIHRSLWPDFLAVARSGEPWQTRGLSAEAKTLLRAVGRSETRAVGKPARELQERLLVHAEEVHTEKGRHETRLQPWRQDVVPTTDVSAARARLEEAVAAIGGKVTSLPWRRFGT